MASNNSNTTMGQSSLLSSDDIYICTTLYALISLASIIGNGLVIIAFFKSSKIRNNRTNYFVVSLSFADIMNGLLAVPLYTYMMHTNFEAYANDDPLNFVYQFFDIFSVIASVWHLAFISLERYFAIVWPVVHHVATSTTYFVVMGIIWFLSLLAAGLSIKLTVYRLKYIISNSTTMFGLPLLIIIFSYASVLRTTIRRSYVTTRRTFERELKVSCTVFILVALFIVCWTPFYVLGLLAASGCHCVSMKMVVYFKALHFTTSCVNPIVYAARIPDFRNAFTKFLPKQLISFVFCLLRKPRQENSSTSRNRTSSTLSSSLAMVDSTARRRPTLLDNKPAVDKLSVTNEPAVSSSVISNKCVTFLSDSPSPIAGSQLTKV